MSKTKQPSAKTKVIELRQADDPNTTVNGDFQSSFEPFSMTEGDSVVLKSCILDTKDASLTKVVVDQDLTLTINALPYVTNYQFDDKSYLTGLEASGVPTAATKQPDHKRYFASQLTDGGTHKILNTVTFTNSVQGAAIKYFVFSIKYKDVNGNLATTGQVYQCPKTRARGHRKQIAVTVPISIQLPIYNDATSVIIPEANANDVVYTFGVTSNVSNGGFLMPIELKHDIDLKAGSYDPQSLCKAINDSVNNNTSGARALQAPFLQDSGEYGSRTYAMDILEDSFVLNNITSDDIYPLPIGTRLEGTGIAVGATIATYDHTAKSGTMSIVGTANGTGVTVTATNTIYMVKEDNTTDPDAFNFHNPLNPDKLSSLFGSSQVQLDIDSSTNKFQWKYLHTPYYDPTTGNQALYFNYVAGMSKMFKLGGTGGIAISGLSAKVTATNEPSLFWSSQVGFSDGTVEGTVPQCNAGVGQWLKNTVGTQTDAMFPVYNNLDSSTTSQFIGSDDAVQKVGVVTIVPPAGSTPAVTTYTDQQFYALSSITSFKATADADSTIAVVAATPYTDLVGNATGYFKIDIAGIAPTELVSSAGTSRSVQAVVTRFYNDGNFTSGSQDSGIVYQHVGGPKMISSLSTRILDPDGSIAKGLGPDNTVFLEILKV